MNRRIGHELEFEGTVIRSYPYSDSHLILKVLTPTQGKVSLIAKSARQSKKRFSGSFDYFDTGKFRVKSQSHSSNALGNVVDFIPQKSFGELRSNLDRLVAGSFLCEVFDSILLEDSQDSSNFYQILILGLEAISKSDDLKNILKGCFLCLATLLKQEGYLEDTPLIPTVKNLTYLIGIVEDHCSKELYSKKSIEELLKRLKTT